MIDLLQRNVLEGALKSLLYTYSLLLQVKHTVHDVLTGVGFLLSSTFLPAVVVDEVKVGQGMREKGGDLRETSCLISLYREGVKCTS